MIDVKHYKIKKKQQLRKMNNINKNVKIYIMNKIKRRWK